MSVPEAAARIELLLSDVDGVMTDGGLTFDDRGVESKTFNVRDGLGVKLWRRFGGPFGIVTGRSSTIVESRARELGVEIVRQSVSDKLSAVRDLSDERGVPLDRIAYLGDDLPDLPVIRAVGFGAAVADAAPEAIEVADFVTRTRGGRGALREVVEVLLKASGRWQAVADEVG